MIPVYCVFFSVRLTFHTVISCTWFGFCQTVLINEHHIAYNRLKSTSPTVVRWIWTVYHKFNDICTKRHCKCYSLFQLNPENHTRTSCKFVQLFCNIIQNTPTMNLYTSRFKGREWSMALKQGSYTDLQRASKTSNSMNTQCQYIY